MAADDCYAAASPGSSSSESSSNQNRNSNSPVGHQHEHVAIVIDKTIVSDSFDLENVSPVAADVSEEYQSWQNTLGYYERTCEISSVPSSMPSRRLTTASGVARSAIPKMSDAFMQGINEDDVMEHYSRMHGGSDHDLKMCESEPNLAIQLHMDGSRSSTTVNEIPVPHAAFSRSMPTSPHPLESSCLPVVEKIFEIGESDNLARLPISTTALLSPDSVPSRYSTARRNTLDGSGENIARAAASAASSYSSAEIADDANSSSSMSGGYRGVFRNRINSMGNSATLLSESGTEKVGRSLSSDTNVNVFADSGAGGNGTTLAEYARVVAGNGNEHSGDDKKPGSNLKNKVNDSNAKEQSMRAAIGASTKISLKTAVQCTIAMGQLYTARQYRPASIEWVDEGGTRKAKCGGLYDSVAYLSTEITSSIDNFFLQMFFGTLPYYSDHSQVLRAFRLQYKRAADRMRSESQDSGIRAMCEQIQLRIINVLKKWFENYPNDFRDHAGFSEDFLRLLAEISSNEHHLQYVKFLQNDVTKIRGQAIALEGDPSHPSPHPILGNVLSPPNSSSSSSSGSSISINISNSNCLSASSSPDGSSSPLSDAVGAKLPRTSVSSSADSFDLSNSESVSISSSSNHGSNTSISVSSSNHGSNTNVNMSSTSNNNNSSSNSNGNSSTNQPHSNGHGTIGFSGISLPGSLSGTIRRSRRKLTFSQQRPELYMEILDYEPEEIAQQITLIEFGLFSAINPRKELIKQVWSKNPGTAANVAISTGWFNKMAMWAAAEVCFATDLTERTLKLKKLIKIAAIAYEINNFNLAFEIIAGLSMSSVYRLKQTWEALSAKSKLRWKELNEKLATTNNSSTYRKRLETVLMSAAPVLHGYHSSGTASQGGGSSRISRDSAVGLSSAAVSASAASGGGLANSGGSSHAGNAGNTGNASSSNTSSSSKITKMPGCVPYLGLILKDLLFAEDGAPTWLASAVVSPQGEQQGEQKKINFVKMRFLHHIINVFVPRLQSMRYHFEEKPDLQMLLKKIYLQSRDEASVYEASLRAEPSLRTHASSS